MCGDRLLRRHASARKAPIPGLRSFLYLFTSIFRGRDQKDSTRGFTGIVCEADYGQQRWQLFVKRVRLETERP